MARTPEEEERLRSASPTQSIGKSAVAPRVRKVFEKHPIVSGITSAIVAGASVAWAILEVVAILGK